MIRKKISAIAALISCLIGVVLFAGSGLAEADGVHATCKARGNTDPGRLNVSVEPDGNGIIPPCRPSLQLYIAQNTQIRAIDGVIWIMPSDARRLQRIPISTGLEVTDFGMLAAEIQVDPMANQACSSLAVTLEIRNCRGDGGGLIDCPEIRVKRPKELAGLSVSGENLDLCHDY